jgi:hypothetical protein
MDLIYMRSTLGVWVSSPRSMEEVCEGGDKEPTHSSHASRRNRSNADLDDAERVTAPRARVELPSRAGQILGPQSQAPESGRAAP